MGFFRYARLALFSKEAGDRFLYRLVKGQRTRRIVELGIESIERTTNVVQLAVEQAKQTSVLYSGFDAFDERPQEEEPLSLLVAHRRLSACGAKVRLTPGGAIQALPSMANSLADTDLVIISAAVTDADLAPVWFYLPRMCHPGTRVIRQQTERKEDGGWATVALEEVRQRASQGAYKQAA